MSTSLTEQPLDLVFVIDPIEKLNAAHDTSVALMEAAQSRGHRVLITSMAALGVHDARATAVCRPVRVTGARLHEGRWHSIADWYTVGPAEHRVLADADAVFVRTDPPVDAAYLRATFVLDLVDRRRTLVVNSPSGLRNANEKLFTLQFPDLCPDTVVTADIEEIIDVTRDWGTAVVKPTDGMAGRGIMLLRWQDPNLRSILEAATVRRRDQVVVQRFIPESVLGDRRVIVLDGVPLGVVRRVASGTEFRCNMATGATTVADSITRRDREICSRIAGHLAANGLVFVGLDVIGDYLTEINVTSPTGVREIDAFTGTLLSESVIAWVEAHTPARTRRTAPPGSVEPDLRRATAAQRS